MKNFNLKNKKGFTLLEALVAVSILMVAVSAPITIAQKGLSSAIYSKDQMIASYLAQDAIEYIKNQRDNETINDDFFDWNNLSIISDCLVDDESDKGCRIDTINNGTIYPDTTPTALIKDLVNKFYGYGTGETTKFFRNIKVKISPGNDDEALVTATVNWGENSVVVKTLIYNY